MSWWKNTTFGGIQPRSLGKHDRANVCPGAGRIWPAARPRCDRYGWIRTVYPTALNDVYIYICIYTLYHMSACVCTCIITYNDRLNWSEYDLPNSWYLTFIGYKPSGWNAWYVLVPGIDWTPFTKRLHQLMVANDPFAQLMMANHRIWTENHH